MTVTLNQNKTDENTPKWPADAAQARIHMIGQAHIDPVWLWPWAEGLSVAHSTFRSALDRMDETPEFAFTASTALLYEWVKENDPSMLAEIKKRVEEGRWAIVGGWWVEPDVNLPSGESLVRQGLYGQIALRRLFGIAARVAYNPDSFGHPNTLPQILKLQGMDEYIFMRPMPQEKKLPANVFWWEASDGSRVLAYRIPFNYTDDGSVRDRILRIIGLKEPTRSMMAFYGAGDHGGGATKENIRSIAEIRGEAGAPVVLYSTPEMYFSEIRKSGLSDFPVVGGDLQHHSVGCYTAESQVKKLNRMTEQALVTAEKIAAIGSAAWGAAYPMADLTSAWKRLLFLQFHDSLGGTALPEHYRTTVPQGYGYAADIASQAMYLAAQKLAWEVPATDPDSRYLLIFNPHAWEVTANAEYDIDFPPDARLSVEDDNGGTVPHQSLPATTEFVSMHRVLFRARLPPFGYRQFRIRRQPGDAEAGVRAIERVSAADGQTMENEHLRVAFNTDGSIALFDKDAQKQVLVSGARGVVLDDPSDTWSHKVTAYDREIGAFGNAKTEVLENGPLRARVRVRSEYEKSTLVIDWLIYSGSRTLEAHISLDWHEHLKMLKFSFPAEVSSPVPTYEVPYGHIARSANGEEDPGQRWVDLGSTDYGLAVINDAKYGYSVKGNDLRISAVRGAPYAHHIPHAVRPDHDIQWQDQGLQAFRLLIVPHKGTWQEAQLPRLADEFTAPLPVIYQGIHQGSRPQSGSFLSADVPNVIVSAIKRAENGDYLILRCFETDGRACSATLDLRFVKRQWSGSFRPSEIKTLRMNLQTGEIREVNALEEEVSPP